MGKKENKPKPNKKEPKKEEEKLPVKDTLADLLKVGKKDNEGKKNMELRDDA